MSADNKPLHWPRVALLDVLRPPQGCHVTDVLLSTYSLDLAVLVSALLALTGRDTEEGCGSKVGLAHAIHHFRPDGPHRIAALVQRGRIALPRSNTKVLTLLDRFVREMRKDQRKESWHAKAALVRFAPETAEVGKSQGEWRLWLGSRNLTRDMSWDTGLVLCTNSSGQKIDGITNIAHALLQESGWEASRQKRLMAELKSQRWDIPDGVLATSIAWLNGSNAWRPQLPDLLDELVVVSPFFDVQTLGDLRQIAGSSVQRTLLTTQLELDRRLANGKEDLDGWSVLCLESSDQGVNTFSAVLDDTSESSQGPEPIISEDEDCPIGLHAKLIAARAGNKVRLIMGSANMTRRAWQRNTEAVAVLDGDRSLWRGVEALLGLGSYPRLDQLSENKDKTAQSWLEGFRNTLCNLQLRQTLKGDVIEVIAAQAPELLLTEEEQEEWRILGVKFDIAPLAGAESDYVPWHPSQSLVKLHRAEGSLAGDTELLCFRLVASKKNPPNKDTEERLCWVQRVPLQPPPGAERDRRIMAHYLSPQQFLSWIRGMLDGYENDPEPWEGGQKQRKGSSGHPDRVATTDLPSIEALLRAWQHDHRSLSQVTDALERYFDAGALQTLHQSEGLAHIDALKRFGLQLEEIRQALGDAGS